MKCGNSLSKSRIQRNKVDEDSAVERKSNDSNLQSYRSPPPTESDLKDFSVHLKFIFLLDQERKGKAAVKMMMMTNQFLHHHDNSQHQQIQSPQSIADYLAQLLKDRKQLAALPNVFTHLERLLDEGECPWSELCVIFPSLGSEWSESCESPPLR